MKNVGKLNQGQGVHTGEKQYGLDRILTLWLSIVKNIKHNAEAGKYNQKMREIIERPIVILDLNAGTGWNDKVNCIGSPLIILDAVKRFPYRTFLDFIEIDEPSSRALYQRLEACKKTGSKDFFECYIGDNKEVLPQILENMDEKRYGLIYHDPNGVPDFDLMRTVSYNPKSRFIDIMFRISGTNYKRTRLGMDAFGAKNCHPHLVGKYPKLTDQLKKINKKHWIIRDIIDPDPYQWTFLMGTNWTDFPAWKKEGFYDTESLRGKEILRRVTYSDEERENGSML